MLYDDPRVFGPTSRTDARHSGSISAVMMVKGLTISPIFLYRSPLPVAITAGIDRNRNGENNDLPDRAYQFDGVGNPPKDIGPCETWNCGRGAWRTQMNLRLSYSFNLYRPVAYRSHRRDLQPVEREEPVDVRDQSARARGSCSRTSSRATSRTPSSASARSGSASRSRSRPVASA